AGASLDRILSAYSGEPDCAGDVVEIATRQPGICQITQGDHTVTVEPRKRRPPANGVVVRHDSGKLDFSLRGNVFSRLSDQGRSLTQATACKPIGDLMQGVAGHAMLTNEQA